MNQPLVHALQCRPDDKDASFKIHVLPSQPEDFALTQPNGDGRRKGSFESRTSDGIQESARLVWTEGLDFRSGGPRRVYESRYVPRNLAILNRNGERAAERH